MALIADRFRRPPDIASAIGSPYSSHVLRDAAVNLRLLNTRLMRPQLINEQCHGAYVSQGYRYRGAAALAMSWRSGCGPIARDYRVLRGSIYGQLVDDVGPTPATTATFVVYSDYIPYTGSLSDVATSATVTFAIADGRTRKTFQLMPRTLGDSHFGWTWITVTAATNGGTAVNDDYAQLWGFYLRADVE